jgi:hypothetical protein
MEQHRSNFKGYARRVNDPGRGCAPVRESSTPYPGAPIKGRWPSRSSSGRNQAPLSGFTDGRRNQSSGDARATRSVEDVFVRPGLCETNILTVVTIGLTTSNERHGPSSHDTKRLAITSLLDSSIIIWPFPLIPRSPRNMKSAFAPFWLSQSTIGLSISTG